MKPFLFSAISIAIIGAIAPTLAAQDGVPAARAADSTVNPSLVPVIEIQHMRPRD